MPTLKPGDSVSLSREGKVFLTQFSSVAGFVSLTRVVGDDPEADIEQMQADLDVMFRESMLRNLQATNECYDALGSDGDVEALVAYLEGSSGSQGQPARKKKVRRKKGKA